MNSFILLGCIGIGVWLWLDTLRNWELTVIACKRVCQQLQLQLLDDTVTLVRFRLKRNRHGWLTIQRVYHFEFFAGGDSRRPGIIIMCGNALEEIELPGYMQRTFFPV